MRFYKYILAFFAAFFFWFPAQFSQAAVPAVEFFYGEGCPHCANVEPFMRELEEKYPDVRFLTYEVYDNESNAQLLLRRYQAFNVPSDERGVPIVFFGDSFLVGDTPILRELEDMIVSARAEVVPIISENEENMTLSETESKQISTSEQIPIMEFMPVPSYSLWAITGAAIVDSINPCAIAVLLILLTALMVGSGDRKRALLGGLAFTASIYITYFLFGIGILQLISITNFSGWISRIVGIVAILIGFANIKDYFFYGGGGFVMEIPRGWRPMLKKFLSGVTSPIGAFLSGFFVTFFELPCTGGPYFFVLGLLSQAKSMVSILPLLAYYNLVFVVPLIFIVFLVYFGISSIDRAEEWKNKNIRILHLIGGLIMLALGAWVLWM